MSDARAVIPRVIRLLDGGASDPNRWADVAAEAGRGRFDELFAESVGHTALLRVRNVARALGTPHLHLKFEGGNPTGTQKDRIAFAHVADALRRGADTLAVASCGNYGAAIAFACEAAGLQCEVCVPAAYHTRRITEMEVAGARVVRTPGAYEDAVDASRNRAARDGMYDANPGGANADVQIDAYAVIAAEIVASLGDAPLVVAVPASNGTTTAGLHRGFDDAVRAGRASRRPRIVVGSARAMNPIVAAWIDGAETCADLAPERIRETAVNEPLINWRAIDGDQALDAVRQTNGWAAWASDRRLLELFRLIKKQEGLQVLPASTAGLAAMLSPPAGTTLEPGDHVALITGRSS